MHLKLKTLLQDMNIAQVDLAKQCVYSSTTIAQLCNHAIWPRSAKQRRLQDTIRNFMKERGASESDIATMFEKVAPPLADGKGPDINVPHEEEQAMSIPKQILHPNTRRHFGLARNPFDEVRSSEEFYQNEHIRYTRAAMIDAAKRGGFIAVVGESGSGKTTLRRDMRERINREQLPIQIMMPYVIGMEENDAKGKTLKASHIAEAIMRSIAPHATLHQSSDARFHQVEAALRESYDTGMRSVLLIEEAHSLPIPTLRHLKRFIELEDGFKSLLAVILLGQTELARKLDPRNASLREVVQRCELITLPPLGHYLEEYVTHRLRQLEIDRKKVITDDGLQAISERLQPPAPRGHEQRSYLYPLAVHNLMIAAMNLAAENGAPVVSADIVQEVSWAR